MAHTDLVSLFTDIANAIRAKKGTSSAIVADNFPSEINTINDSVPLLCDNVTYRSLTPHTVSDKLYLSGFDIASKDKIQFVSIKTASFTATNSGTGATADQRYVVTYTYHKDPSATTGYREFGESVYVVKSGTAAELHTVLGAETYFEIEYDSVWREYYVRSLNPGVMGKFGDATYRVSVGTRR